MILRNDPVIRTVAFASCYVYSPTGTGQMCDRSRLLRRFLKAGDAGLMVKHAGRVSQLAAHCAELRGFFTHADVFIPVPGSSPYRAGHVWAAAQLASALLEQGLGQTCWCGLKRRRAVRKSATAAPGSRPSVALHYDSFVIDSGPMSLGSVVLIDDVVTKGRTLLAAASRIHETFPNAKVRAFALIRTMGVIAGIRHLVDPCQGEIAWRGGDAQRTP